MALNISTNIASINAQKTMDKTQRAMDKSFSQLSSGSRITKAADDAAGLSISETLKSTIRGYTQAKRNASDGISMVQVAEGGLAEISNILTRFRELGVQASSDTVGTTERGFIDKEVQQLKSELQRIAETTRFGGNRLLDGSGDIFNFQVDIGNDDFQDRITFDSSTQVATLDEFFEMLAAITFWVPMGLLFVPFLILIDIINLIQILAMHDGCKKDQPNYVLDEDEGT